MDFPHPSAQKPPITVSEVETLKFFSGGAYPQTPPNIIKLMSITLFFAPLNSATIVFALLDEETLTLLFVLQ